MENTDFPETQVTLKKRCEVRGGDGTLKRKVAAKSSDGDVSGAVVELASAEVLAPHYGDTLWAMKKKHPICHRKLLPSRPTWWVCSSGSRHRKCLKSNQVCSCWIFWWTRWPTPWPISFDGGPWFGGARIVPSIIFNWPDERHAERWGSKHCSSNTVRRQWMHH